MKLLNKRLEILSAFINQDDCVLDIGCDHGLLGIYLTLNKNIKVISSDINLKPLEKAKENIIKYNLTDKIETRLGNGLEVMSDDINTIVISGMGGLNIINILKDIKKYPSIKKLVLSPNSDFIEMRESITKLGFKINKETMVKDHSKFYLITEFIIGKEKTNYYFGKLDLNNETIKEYYEYIYKTNLEIINKLGNSNNVKKQLLLNENSVIKEHVSIKCS